MRGFKQNHCRICPLVLCCVKCRVKHERLVHNITTPDCDICVYGQAVIKNPSEELLDHLQQVHLPLHCVFCKKVYVTIDDLLNHSQCQGAMDEAPPTPTISLIKANETVEYCSPPLEALIYKNGFGGGNLLNVDSRLTTSTPMQRDTKKLPKSIQDSSTDSHSNISNIKKTDVTHEKRKVTFCETPVYEGSQTRSNDEEGNKEDVCTPGVSGIDTPGTEYYSTTEQVKSEEKESTPDRVQDKDGDSGSPLNQTLWESAMNTTQQSDDHFFKVTPIIDKYTPISANLKKRKKNVNLVAAMDAQEAMNREEAMKREEEIKREELRNEEEMKRAEVMNKEQMTGEQERNRGEAMHKEEALNTVGTPRREGNPKNMSFKLKMEELKNEKVLKPNIFVSTKLGVSDIGADLENSINESISTNKKEAIGFSDSNHFWNTDGRPENEISSIQNLSEHNDTKENKENKDNKEGIWSSVSRIVKNAIGFSTESLAENLSNHLSKISLKRSFSESEADHLNYLPTLKRSKYADIRGRKPIRDLNIPLSKYLDDPYMSRYDSDPEVFQNSVNVSGEVPPKKNHNNKITQTDF